MQDHTRSRHTSTSAASRWLLLATVLMGASVLSACSGSDSDPVAPVEDTLSEPVGPDTGSGELGDVPAPPGGESGVTGEPGDSGEADAGIAETDDPGTSDGAETGSTEALDPGTTAATGRYRLVFDGRWSAETHPQGFPGGPHFSGLVGSVHSEQVRFWEPGQIATDGVKNVAETGGKSPMTDEVRAAIDAGTALSLVDGPGVPDAPGTASVEFEVTRDYHQLTLVTMLAPSPDWFAGVHNLPLLVDGAFVDGVTVELSLYDAGTDSGLTYAAADDPTEPRSPIMLLTSEPADSPFIDGAPAIGSFQLERLP